MTQKQAKQVQLMLDPQVRAAGKIRAEQRRMTMSGHVSDLIVTDATEAKVWALLNREEACDD